MYGRVVTYDDSRGYGTILGDDGVSYFFHQNAVVGDTTGIGAEREVMFTPFEGMQGSTATNVILQDAGDYRFEFSKRFMTSKTGEVYGWEVMCRADCRLEGPYAPSADAAGEAFAQYLKAFGANGAVELGYKKKKTQGGTILHRFSGIPAFVGRRSRVGDWRLEDFQKALSRFMNAYYEQQAKLQKELAEKRKRTSMICAAGLSVALVLFGAFMLLLLTK